MSLLNRDENRAIVCDQKYDFQLIEVNLRAFYDVFSEVLPKDIRYTD
jgi:hypothetical protein